jgi:hypothetical protein
LRLIFGRCDRALTQGKEASVENGKKRVDTGSPPA